MLKRGLRKARNMPITPDELLKYPLTPAEVGAAATFAYHVVTHMEEHPQLQTQDPLACFTEALLGELAEQMVVGWLREQKKQVRSEADKGAHTPDLAHELWVEDIRGKRVRMRITVHLAAQQISPAEMLSQTRIHFIPDEIGGINVQVCFWLPLGGEQEMLLPALQNAALAGWLSGKNLREAGASLTLQDLRPMQELLAYLV